MELNLAEFPVEKFFNNIPPNQICLQIFYDAVSKLYFEGVPHMVDIRHHGILLESAKEKHLENPRNPTLRDDYQAKCQRYSNTHDKLHPIILKTAETLEHASRIQSAHMFRDIVHACQSASVQLSSDCSTSDRLRALENEMSESKASCQQLEMRVQELQAEVTQLNLKGQYLANELTTQGEKFHQWQIKQQDHTARKLEEINSSFRNELNHFKKLNVGALEDLTIRCEKNESQIEKLQSWSTTLQSSKPIHQTSQPPGSPNKSMSPLTGPTTTPMSIPNPVSTSGVTTVSGTIQERGAPSQHRAQELPMPHSYDPVTTHDRAFTYVISKLRHSSRFQSAVLDVISAGGPPPNFKRFQDAVMDALSMEGSLPTLDSQVRNLATRILQVEEDVKQITNSATRGNQLNQTMGR
ncbi:uncharacterized protein MELLADRAFT_87322 [Melampsora larici-populina 98AG31]|uniref:Uncharacterized protein n=1 Tax=Melampsora larici-populina (strain 98AG31 / pathotype 3-4-7) TaxID=747676 RepID=F4RMU3_MELLP|nr:uncharacterized protein MELLADRAFT_87322 [Melampsora larici-populina 98AG31]EGG06170.1 hypothetical protein MELLADRAFT_87322 [Melampsora larici-populina 98AG31]